MNSSQLRDAQLIAHIVHVQVVDPLIFFFSCPISHTLNVRGDYTLINHLINLVQSIA